MQAGRGEQGGQHGQHRPGRTQRPEHQGRDAEDEAGHGRERDRVPVPNGGENPLGRGAAEVVHGFDIRD